MNFASLATSVAGHIDQITDWISINFAFFFNSISWIILSIEEPIAFVLTETPYWVTIIFFVVLSGLVGGWRLTALMAFGLVFMVVFNLWVPAMMTLALVLTAAVLALLIGVPIGVLTAEFPRVNVIVQPILDFMQTMPPFVLLVPAVFFFGIGTVPAIVATIFFAMPLPIRLTAHGLKMVDSEFVEAGEAFGANRLQTLLQIKLPLAFGSIMAGVNQCIMMSLSMVIVASMIGAGGLGDEIIRSITRLRVGSGMLAGVSVVLLAILIDRFSKKIGDRFDPSR